LASGELQRGKPDRDRQQEQHDEAGHRAMSGRKRSVRYSTSQANRPIEDDEQQREREFPGLHQCTLTRAVPPIPIAFAAARDRSMQRPRTNGPRSVIRTVTLRPLQGS
jgi:hypothetical protein